MAGEVNVNVPSGDNPTTNPTDGGTTIPDVPSTLPSQNQEVDYTPFNLSDDIKSKMKDGKINGRFASVQEVLDKLKETEDKFANDVRTNQNSSTEAQIQAADNAKKIAVINELTPEFLKNGMVLTEDIKAKAIAAGLTTTEIELEAYKLRDSATSAHSIVGGKENYDAMIDWARTTMDEAQRTSFNAQINSGMRDYAIKGLNADYQAALADGEIPDRITGQPASQGVTAYASRKELYADKDAAELAKRRGNLNDWNKYQKKLQATRKLSGGINGLPRF